MFEHVLSVKMLRTKALFSPAWISERVKAMMCVDTLAGNHVGDLNDRVNLGFWENALPPGALDIKAQNP
jgi:hypothetical protein